MIIRVILANFLVSKSHNNIRIQCKMKWMKVIKLIMRMKMN